MDNRQPLLIVFAGPNGSGKSTITNCFPDYERILNTVDCSNEQAIFL